MIARLARLAPLLVALASVIGCATATTSSSDPAPSVPQDDDSLPKISDFDPQFHTPSRRPDLPQPTGASVGIIVLECSVNHAIDKSREMLSTDGLSPRQLERWRDNGLVVGKLPMAALSAFVDELPPRVRSGRRRLSGFAVPQILTEQPARRMRQVIELKLPDGQQARVPASEGTWRMMLHARRLDGGGGALLQVWPHLYFQTPTLQPRRHEQLLLEGRSYRELAVAATPAPTQVLVIMPAPPPPRPEADPLIGERDVENEEDRPDPLNPDRPRKADPPDLTKLGPALLTGRRANVDYQRIILIQSQP